MNKSHLKNRNVYLIKYCLFFCFGGIVMYCSLLFIHFPVIEYIPFDLESFAQIGTIFGPIISLFAVVILIKTLNTQRRTLEEQKSIFDIESFENKFFILLRTHREISSELKMCFPYLDSDFEEKERIVFGREVFVYARLELKKIWESISQSEYLGKFEIDYVESIKREIEELHDPDNCDPTLPPWSSEEKIETIRKKQELRFTNKLYNITETGWQSIQKKGKRERVIILSEIFFHHYSYAISHYYRHLYLIVSFVDQFEIVKKEEKQKYISFIQAQMSSSEFALLFYYSVSNINMPDLGKCDFFKDLNKSDLLYKSHMEDVN